MKHQKFLIGISLEKSLNFFQFKAYLMDFKNMIPESKFLIHKLALNILKIYKMVKIFEKT